MQTSIAKTEFPQGGNLNSNGLVNPKGWKAYTASMKPARKWIDPAKRPPSQQTMETPGNFADFTENMRKLMKVKPEKKPASPGPASAS